METGSKLSLLMSLFDVNTRMVARAIHVDPSSVSRWVNGKRSLKANSDYLHKIASYFLHIQAFDLQKKRLVELLYPGNPAGVSPESLEERLCEWLVVDDRPAALRRVEPEAPASAGRSPVSEFMRGMLDPPAIPMAAPAADTASGAPPDMPAGRAVSPAGIRTAVELYAGDEGIRRALLETASSLLASEAPGRLLITSQDDLSWYTRPDFLPVWMRTVGELLARGNSIRVIFRLHRNAESILTLIRNWAPLILSGQVEAYYYSYYTEPAVALTFAVAAGRAAMFSMKGQTAREHAVTYVYRDAASVSFFENMYLGLLDAALPLVTVFRSGALPALLEETAALESRKGDEFHCAAAVGARHLPTGLYGRLLERTALPEEARTQNLACHERRRAAFREMTAAGRCYEIIELGALDLMTDRRGFRYAGADLFAPDGADATPAEVLEHLRALLHEVTDNPGYLLALVSGADMLPPGIHAWCVKRDAGVMIGALGGAAGPLTVMSREATVVQGFEDYFLDVWARIPQAQRDRDAVAARLRSRIAALEDASGV